ncbi:DNA repair protein RecN [Pedobacter sp. BS3]|uniref:DNA repair protein RecN n=1 Tax=Pedobacter sp. BS3 TaxID=2567937 RepID=UPI0011EEAD9B|nr:DNA repair protein RecN [Pedobacter sp. BS3]TZF81898.1 DNA repair protein RecN [Pedobacter sp. BS3]
MLSRLFIQNYALIDTLDISFSNQLNILTGETGAGKSIILGALSLILGQRTESRYLVNQQQKCIIEGTFSIGNYQLNGFFEDNDLDYQNETLLRREIAADGRSRAFINDTPVTLSVLKQLGEQLIDIHSQHATLEINDDAFQLLVVDVMAGNKALLSRYRDTFSAYRKKQAELEVLIRESEQAKADADYLQFQFDELEKAALNDDEEQQQLELELGALSHAEEIKRNLLAALILISEGENPAGVQLKESLAMVRQSEKFNPRLSDLSTRLESLLIELKDIQAEIEQVEQHTLIDEERLLTVNERLDSIYSLQKKHRVSTIAELKAIRDTVSDKLNSMLFTDEAIETLKADLKLLFAELVDLADNLSASRNEIIPQLEQKISTLLADVGMPDAVLKIENTTFSDDNLNINGRNAIRFLFSANKGQAPAPMNKVASGGELSRLMLCIKSLISRHIALPTIIFDEIDTGISGEIALKVGNMMEKLAEDMQVIAITHLPQIASKGNAHYRVYKYEESGITLSNITRLSPDERVEEIAKMLGGANPGEHAVSHARELIQKG